MSAWNSVKSEEEMKEDGQREFINFDKKTHDVVIQFENNDLDIKEDTKYHRPRYTMKVNGDKLFSTTSQRLMAELKKFVPVAGRQFHITQIGYGVKVQFEVEEIVPEE